MKKSIMAYCQGKHGAVKEYPFGPEPEVYKVGGKMFAFIYEGAEDACRINLKCDPVIAGNLREQLESVKPGYHMNKKHWNTVIVDGSLSLAEIYDMIDHSYSLVVSKLPRSQRDLLQEQQ
ncbi:MmcQ-like protein [Paenibacillus sp. FSL R7-0273]|uniref:MmcQ/YjbR family DNA-binding protein n=1 Tax=Paenibacillus sp. FSL R7-0273 TaxID=1536772 RepID=UPI0004F72170|nr:MmcQ/YjbR family DNA-binding protein [Paenibacillus sp. FSL R7-0273]AIQ47213.1 MmcQ-like protein [Paenibacillus sp. FSL R7-0273]OMF91533.1 MmcQ-like protein [Paenibacillus sp. FSL R7-0273]